MLQSTLYDIPHHDRRFVPNLTKRSNEELIFSALVLQITGQLTLNTFAQLLCEADKLDELDLVFSANRRRFGLEWDGGYYHPEYDIERDIRKTMKILEKNPSMYIVRIRVGAPRIRELEQVDRCVLVHVPAGTAPLDAIPLFVAAIRAFVPEAVNWTSVKSAARAEVEVNNLRCVCDSVFGAAFARVRTLLGDAAHRFVADTHGVRSNLDAVADGMERLKYEWKMSSDELRKFMCNSVASAFADDDKARVFFINLSKLKAQCDLKTADHWCKIMCDSVASRLKRGKGQEMASLINRVGVQRFRTVAIPFLDFSTTFAALSDREVTAILASRTKRRALVEDFHAQKRRRVCQD